MYAQLHVTVRSPTWAWWRLEVSHVSASVTLYLIFETEFLTEPSSYFNEVS